MIYTIEPDLSIRTIDNEFFILKRKTSTIHSFNGTGTLIWKSLQTDIPIADIVQSLVNQFGISKGTAEEDVSDFLFTLEKNKLIALSE
jgi:hypothetical protein